jgi:Cu-processing system permease protein
VSLSLLLAAVFVAVAMWASIVSHRRVRAFGLSLGLWFFFVLFYDLLMIGSVALLNGPNATTILFVSLFGNPVDMVRVAALLSIENAAIFGPAGAALVRFLGGAWPSGVLLVAGLLAWIMIPVAISTRILRRQDL